MDFRFNDINEAFHVLYHQLMQPHNPQIFERDSRNGKVRESIYPAVVNYTQPRRRVLFHPARDANPFFHLFESIWMLAGRNDLAFLVKFLPSFAQYSDDGKTVISAYGARWQEHLPVVVDRLRKDRDTRRAYIPIFEPDDVALTGADMPCNTGVSFYIRHGLLDMTVFNRSNDLIWGTLGANAVHFSFLQEYTAALLGIPVGTYSQVSSCLHLYMDFEVTKKLEGKVSPMPDHTYAINNVQTSPWHVLSHRDDRDWQADAKFFLDDYCYADNATLTKYRGHWWREPFFLHVAAPMFDAWHAWKERDFKMAFKVAARIDAPDWKLAVTQWLLRRYKNVIKARNADPKAYREALPGE